MFRIDRKTKQDPKARWALSDPVFFASGACHILTYAFLKRYPDAGYSAIWIRPIDGYTGNHIVAKRGDEVFDFHGHMKWLQRFSHYKRKAKRWYPEWGCTLMPLPMDALISEKKSREYNGLWLREPSDFLCNAMPRAEAYLARFDASFKSLHTSYRPPFNK